MRKFLVVLDDSRECLNAMRFAAMRAEHTGADVEILSVIPPDEFNHWVGVGDIMREEARDRIEAHFKVFSERMQKEEGISPELVIREGKVEAEIIDYIQDEPDVGVLVLGAGTGKEGPGPLINYVLCHSGTLPIPVTVVPGAMSPETSRKPM